MRFCGAALLLPLGSLPSQRETRLKSACVGLVNGRIRMVIFPARRIGFLPPKQALPAAAVLASMAESAARPTAFAGISLIGYAMFSIGPNFETLPAQVA